MNVDHCFPVQNPDTPARTVEGRATVITLHDSRLHRLNETATFIWDRATGQAPVSAIAEDLANAFAISAEQARDDVMSFLHEASTKGLLALKTAPSPPV